MHARRSLATLLAAPLLLLATGASAQAPPDAGDGAAGNDTAGNDTTGNESAANDTAGNDAGGADAPPVVVPTTPGPEGGAPMDAPQEARGGDVDFGQAMLVVIGALILVGYVAFVYVRRAYRP